MRFSSYLLPISVSLLFHGLIVAIVLYGWEAADAHRTVKVPKYVEAKLVQLKTAAPVKKSVPKPKVIDLTKKRKEQERLRKLEEQKRLALKKKKEEEAKKLADEKKKEQERIKEEQRLAELERQKQQRQQMEDELAQALAEEQEILTEESDLQQAQSYIALIAERIEQRWSRPPSARKGMVCELMINLVPTGKVVSVNIVKSSGNGAFDRSAEQAVKKVDRFPEIQDMPAELFERNFRQLRLVFNPKDLRL